MIDIVYIPKGGMCATCCHIHDDCSQLEFIKMRKLTKPDENNTVIVRCRIYLKQELTK